MWRNPGTRALGTSLVLHTLLLSILQYCKFTPYCAVYCTLHCNALYTTRHIKCHHTSVQCTLYCTIYCTPYFIAMHTSLPTVYGTLYVIEMYTVLHNAQTAVHLFLSFSPVLHSIPQLHTILHTALSIIMHTQNILPISFLQWASSVTLIHDMTFHKMSENDIK